MCQLHAQVQNLFYIGKRLPIKSNNISIFYTYLWPICCILKKMYLPQIPHNQSLPKPNQLQHFTKAIQEQDFLK